MSHGLRIHNLSGGLVFDCGAAGYSYRGQATLQQPAYKDTEAWLRPYIFQWMAPDGLHRPIAAVQLPPGMAAAVMYVELAGGTTWNIAVHSVSVPTADAVKDITFVQPVVEMFYPGAQAESHGLRLYRADGSVSYDVARTPLFVKEAVYFPGRTYVVNSGSGSGDFLAASGDASGFNPGFGPLAVIGSPSGYAIRSHMTTGETEDEFTYVWGRTGSQLNRVRVNTFNRTYGGGPAGTPDEAFQATLNPTRAFLLDLANLV